MGSQQLFLLIVTVVLVGVGVSVGVWMFIDQSTATNRDQLANDLVQFAAQAQKYYRRPATLGGGNSSFSGLTLSRITSKPENANGRYELSPDPAPASAAYVTITGFGKENGVDRTAPVKLVMTVWPDSLMIVAEN